MKSLKRSIRNLTDLGKRANAAEDVLAAITLDDDDLTVANAAAGWLLTRYLPIWKFSVIVDKGKTLEPYDWKYKNTVGIKTDDPDRACAWITAALLAGYSVFAHSRPSSTTGNSCGSIKSIRWNIKNSSHIFSPHSDASQRKQREKQRS